MTAGLAGLALHSSREVEELRRQQEEVERSLYRLGGAVEGGEEERARLEQELGQQQARIQLRLHQLQLNRTQTLPGACWM